MKIILSERAEKELRKLSKIDQIAVAQKLRLLQTTQNVYKEERLRGFRDIFRVRFGHYRIVYRKTKEEIFVVLIAHRKDVYFLLERLMK